jgi:sec-independent protein translocase protein TatB
VFGLSWGQISIIVLVGVFVLGPERIPTAVRWVTDGLRKLRTMAAGAQAQLNREIGPELDELRRQIADLQSLKEIQELRDLRDLHPKRLIGNTILGEEFAGGGIGGFLGLTGAGATKGGSPSGQPPVKPVTATPPSAPASVPGPAAAPAPPVPVPPAPVTPVAVTAARPATGPPRLAAPKVVGGPRRVPAASRPAEAVAGFDVDAT